MSPSVEALTRAKHQRARGQESNSAIEQLHQEHGTPVRSQAQHELLYNLETALQTRKDMKACLYTRQTGTIVISIELSHTLVINIALSHTLSVSVSQCLASLSHCLSVALSQFSVWLTVSLFTGSLFTVAVGPHHSTCHCPHPASTNDSGGESRKKSNWIVEKASRTVAGTMITCE